MKKIIGFLFLVFLALNSYLYGASKINEKEVLALVNGEPITVKEFLYAIGIEHRREDLGKASQVDFNHALEKMIKDKLIIQEAREMGLETNPWLEARLKEFTVTAAVRALYKDEILAKIKPSKAQLKKFYQDYFKIYNLTVLETETKEEALKKRMELQKGGNGKSFDTTLYALYQDKDYWRVIKNLKPGQVSEPFKKHNRFIVVKLNSIKPANLQEFEKRYNSVKDAYERMEKKRLEEVKLKELRKKYANEIWIDNELLEKLKKEPLKTWEKDERVIAKVKNESLTLKELAEQIKNNFHQEGGNLSLEKRIEKWIDFKLVDLEALSRGYHLKGSVKEDIENYKIQLLKRVFIGVAIAPKIKISDKELKDFYEKNKEKFKESDSVKLYRMILKDHQTALQVISELEKGANFKFLAEKFSNDEVVRKTGGDMGWIKISLVPENYKQAFKTFKKGEIGMVQEGPHWTVLYIGDYKKGTYRPFEEVKEKVKEELFGKKIEEELDKYAEKLRPQSKIVVYRDKVKRLEREFFK